MALLVWLPLNGNLNNQGLSDIEVTNNGATVSDGGKIGKCFSFGHGQYIDTGLTWDKWNFGKYSVSFCGWFKFNKTDIENALKSRTYTSKQTSPVGNLLGFNSYGGLALVWQATNFVQSLSLDDLKVAGIIRIGDTTKSAGFRSVEYDKWIHYAVTFEKSSSILSLYIDGVLTNATTGIEFDDTQYAHKNFQINGAHVHGGNGPGVSIPVKVNDVRIYDHCLSPKEVHEVAKGLVLHYKLDTGPMFGKNLLASNYHRGTDTGQTSSNEYINLFSAVDIWDTYGLVPYTVSFDAKSAVPHSFNLYGTYGSGPRYTFTSTNISVDTEWKRFFYTFTPKINKSEGTWAGCSLYGIYGSGAIISVRRVKLELGSVATPMGYETTEEDVFNNHNLITNGFGGTPNWINSAQIFTDLPSPAVSGVTNSYGPNQTKEFIPLIPDHSYTMSGYVKRGDSTYPHCYLTLIPFDADKLQINVYMTPEGFRAASKTTLTQELKNGDTVVHLEDVSKWSTSLTYGIWIAIFGYKNSSGTPYLDMTYTRHVVQFGTTTDKSHIDFTNNTVTLNQPWDRGTIPAGTAACQSTSGAGYYYPSVINTTGSDSDEWHFLEKTFVPADTPFLKAAKYVRVYAALYNGQRSAGLKLIDNSAQEAVVSDISGYNNDGYLNNTPVTVEDGAPRYEKCIENHVGYLLGSPISLNEVSEITIACWVYPTAHGYQTSGLWTTSGYLITSDRTSDYNNTACSHVDTYFQLKGTDGVLYRISCNSSDIPLNTWTHVALTHDGSDIKLYKNGSFLRSKSCPTSLVGFNSFWLGESYNRGMQGKWSDLRIYSTALSSDDVKELYNVGAWIDNSGNLGGYISNEINSSPKVHKTGEVVSTNFVEYSDLLKVLDDGSLWLKILHHNNPAENLFTQTNCWWYDDGENLYSTLGLLRDYPGWDNDNGEYEFLACEKATSTGTEKQYRWKQTSNPATSNTLSGYELISGNPGRDIGLMNKGSNACFHNGNGWWCACGSWTAYQGGIPGFGGVVTSGYMDLYIRISDIEELKGFQENKAAFYKDSILSNQIIEI